MDRSSGSEREERGMDLYRVLMKRRSARAFRDQEIPEPWIEQMLDVAANGPPASLVSRGRTGNREVEADHPKFEIRISKSETMTEVQILTKQI